MGTDGDEICPRLGVIVSLQANGSAVMFCGNVIHGSVPYGGDDGNDSVYVIRHHDKFVCQHRGEFVVQFQPPAFILSCCVFKRVSIELHV